jgi:hypothetical protein
LKGTHKETRQRTKNNIQIAGPKLGETGIVPIVVELARSEQVEWVANIVPVPVPVPAAPVFVVMRALSELPLLAVK